MARGFAVIDLERPDCSQRESESESESAQEYEAEERDLDSSPRTTDTSEESSGRP